MVKQKLRVCPAKRRALVVNAARSLRLSTRMTRNIAESVSNSQVSYPTRVPKECGEAGCTASAVRRCRNALARPDYPAARTPHHMSDAVESMEMHPGGERKMEARGTDDGATRDEKCQLEVRGLRQSGAAKVIHRLSCLYKQVIFMNESPTPRHPRRKFRMRARASRN